MSKIIKSAEKPLTLFERISNADSHHRLFVAGTLAVAVSLALAGRVPLIPHIFLSWDTFSITILVLAWIRMFSADPKRVRKTAKLQDSSQTLVFAFVVVSACASLFAMGVLLGGSKNLSQAAVTDNVILAMITVLCSWLLIHTVFTLRYAHTFYSIDDDGSDELGSGLEFPNEKEPDYLDFAYFSFVIGMTCQVSDVQISSRYIRKLALVHGLVSFVFNTIIVALTINIVSGLF